MAEKGPMGYIRLKKPAPVIARQIIRDSVKLEATAVDERTRMKGYDYRINVTNGEDAWVAPGRLYSRSISIQNACVVVRGKVAPIAIKRSADFTPTTDEAQTVLAQSNRLRNLGKELKGIAKFKPLEK